MADIEMRLVQPGMDAADDALVRMLEDVRKKSPQAALFVNALTNDQELRRRIRAIAVETGGRLEPFGRNKRGPRHASRAVAPRFVEPADRRQAAAPNSTLAD
jgi:hypothetical protein